MTRLFIGTIWCYWYKISQKKKTREFRGFSFFLRLIGRFFNTTDYITAMASSNAEHWIADKLEYLSK